MMLLDTVGAVVQYFGAVFQTRELAKKPEGYYWLVERCRGCCRVEKLYLNLSEKSQGFLLEVNCT